MKMYKTVACILLSVILLAGCNRNEQQTDNAKDSIAVEKTEDAKEDVSVSSEEIGNEVKSEELKSSLKNAIAFNLTTVLYEEEAKVDVVFIAQDEDSKIVWQRVWKDIYLSELNPHSDYVVWEDKVYLEIHGELYGMNKFTGEEIFSPIVVGSIEIPVIDNDGAVYCTGYYGPLVTKVSKTGEVLWQIDDHFDMVWPSKPIIEGEFVYVKFESFGDSGLNLSQINKTNGSIEKFYWIDDGALFWEKVEASSTLEGYPVENIIGSDSTKAWVEGKTDDGIGEWILFESPVQKRISKLVLKNGYHKSNELYLKNNRIKTLEIIDANGESYIFELKDTMQPIEIKFEKAIESDSLKLNILSVYKGTKYEDTVISGIQFY